MQVFPTFWRSMLLHFYGWPPSVLFLLTKETWRFLLLWKMVKSNQSIQHLCSTCDRGSSTRAEIVATQLLSGEPHLTSQHQAPWLWPESVSICALSPCICTSINKMRPKVSEKPERVRKGVMLSMKLGIIVPIVNKMKTLSVHWACLRSPYCLSAEKEHHESCWSYYQFCWKQSALLVGIQ